MIYQIQVEVGEIEGDGNGRVPYVVNVAIDPTRET
jgi:hypothetical protein